MVRHDDPRMVFAAFALVEFQDTLQNLPVGEFLQQTGTDTFIQPLLEPPYKATVVFRLLFDGPWFAPCIPLAFFDPSTCEPVPLATNLRAGR